MVFAALSRVSGRSRGCVASLGRAGVEVISLSLEWEEFGANIFASGHGFGSLRCTTVSVMGLWYGAGSASPLFRPFIPQSTSLFVHLSACPFARLPDCPCVRRHAQRTGADDPLIPPSVGLQNVGASCKLLSRAYILQDNECQTAKVTSMDAPSVFMRARHGTARHSGARPPFCRKWNMNQR